MSEDKKHLAQWLPRLTSGKERTDTWKRPYMTAGRVYAGFAETLMNTLRWYKHHKMAKFEQPGWALDDGVIAHVKAQARRVIDVAAVDAAPDTAAYLSACDPTVLARYTAMDIRFQQLTGQRLQTVLDFGSGVGRQAWYWADATTCCSATD